MFCERPLNLHLYLSEDFLPLLVRGEVGAIPIATGEVQRRHTRDAYSCTQAIVVGLRETSP